MLSLKGILPLYSNKNFNYTEITVERSELLSQTLSSKMDDCFKFQHGNNAYHHIRETKSMVKPPCGHFDPLFPAFLIRAGAETESTTQGVALGSVGQPGEVAGPAGLALCTFGTNRVTPPVTTTTLPTSVGVAVTHPASLHEISYSRPMMTRDS
jgi:hypothetical protein